MAKIKNCLFLLILFLAIILKFKINCEKVICNRRTETEIDSSFARIFVFGQNMTRFPENSQQLGPYCNEIQTLYDKVMQYTKQCLNKFGKDSAAVLLYSVGVEIRSVCKANRITKKTKELLTAAACLNTGAIYEFGDCYNTWIDKYMGIMSVALKMKIPMACCNFHEFQRCVISEGQKVAKCTLRSLDFLDKWFANMMDGIVQLLCSVYDNSNTECDNIVAKTPNRSPNQKRYKSILIPTLNIAKALGEDEILD